MIIIIMYRIIYVGMHGRRAGRAALSADVPEITGYNLYIHKSEANKTDKNGPVKSRDRCVDARDSRDGCRLQMLMLMMPRHAMRGAHRNRLFRFVLSDTSFCWRSCRSRTTV